MTLVVLGSGWGATSLLKELDTEDYNSMHIVISQKNFFLFTPLLPSVAVDTLNVGPSCNVSLVSVPMLVDQWIDFVDIFASVCDDLRKIPTRSTISLSTLGRSPKSTKRPFDAIRRRNYLTAFWMFDATETSGIDLS
ncbi:hypothetical protein HYDPIDRAFT_33439 [Hydnomerulius pinastri MD-312]|uniref:NADH:ubiquinone reductase (non-electrogenic) n=1 Tax=Hydnomerulius pinastri MD-312 TaxID=994086 RepID=A0A0C9VNJ5_9AGAM|nr:hypothetical protein HYDPIDRAFT_33439 [Hydnomerulius pinastri MD-312]